MDSLAEELEGPPETIVSMSQGLIHRPWLPHFMDRSAADEIAESLRSGKEMARKLSRPLDDMVYCAASWPSSSVIPEAVEARAEIHRRIRAKGTRHRKP